MSTVIIDVKDAVKKAVEYINGLYPPDQIQDLMLEEIELSDDERYWLITLGFTRSSDVNLIKLFANRDLPRVYKVVKVKTDTGQPEGMKNRES